MPCFFYWLRYVRTERSEDYENISLSFVLVSEILFSFLTACIHLVIRQSDTEVKNSRSRKAM